MADKLSDRILGMKFMKKVQAVEENKKDDNKNEFWNLELNLNENQLIDSKKIIEKKQKLLSKVYRNCKSVKKVIKKTETNTEEFDHNKYIHSRKKKK